MRVLILGCGRTGAAAGALLAARGHEVLGVRRSPAADPAPVPVVAGDLADPALHDRVGGRWDAVLLAATPGLRRGRDNRLREGAALVVRRMPHARLVCTGTTAVYADAGGADVDEDAALGPDPASQALLGIERAALVAPRALVLRVGAIVGPGRTALLDRLRAGDWTVKGDPDRPFSYIHEADLAELCAEALAGRFGHGVLNAVAPHATTLRGYLEGLARRERLSGHIVGGGDAQPARRVVAQRLQQAWPEHRWRACDER